MADKKSKRFHASGVDRSVVGKGEYEGVHGRKSLESADFGMFGESKSSFANMPQEMVLKAFPKAGRYSDYGIDDTVRGIDKQMDEDGAAMKREMKTKGKY